MVFTDLQQDPRTSFRSFRLVRRVLFALAVLYFLTLVTHQTLLPVLFFLVVSFLGVAALVLAPALIIENRNWKSVCYAAVLLAAFPVWVFSLVWIIKTSNEINDDRARNFIVKVKQHVAHTGVLPKSEEELAAAGFSLPRTVLVSKMTYRVLDAREISWMPYPASRETGVTNSVPKHPPFAISYDAGIWVRCEHFSHVDNVHCDD